MGKIFFKGNLAAAVLALSAGLFFTAQAADSEYPYTIKPLPQNKVSALDNEFQSNNHMLCGVCINKYGFADTQSNLLACNAAPRGRNEDIPNGALLIKVKEELLRNKKFFNIVRYKDLEGAKENGLMYIKETGKYKFTMFDFPEKSPAYKGLPIMGLVGGIKVTCWQKDGHWETSGYFLPEFTAPTEEKVSEAQAKSKVIGKKFTYGDFAGNPGENQVTEQSLGQPAQKVIFVKETPRGLEFHLAWLVSAGESEVYIDAITGEELETMQMFQT